MAVKHSFVNPKSDDGDTTHARPSDWNANHTIDNDTITEAQISTADNTTKDVSTSKHGFAPKITGSDGDVLTKSGSAAVWSTPAGGSDLVQTASGAGSIRADGLRGYAKLRAPGGGNDNEFSSSTLGGSAVGSPLTIDANTTIPSHLYIEANSGGINGRLWTAPSFPFTVEAKFGPRNFGGIAGATGINNRLGGIVLAVASPGVCIVAGFIVWGASDLRPYAAKYSNPTTWSSDIWATSGFGTGPSVYYMNNGELHMRIVATSTSSLAFDYSFDGYIWHNMTSGYDPSATITQVGLSMGPGNSGTGIGSFDYLRFT